jgi:Lipopolysaccharide biosynthesis proteins, LPS:glycosyltransferases
MNVLFAINDKFVPGFLTAAVSFCVNNPGKHSIFVMHDGLSSKSQANIRKVISRFSAEVHLIAIGRGAFDDPLYTNLPRYYSQSINRLLPQLAVPEQIHRLLYLDSDVVVNGSLEEFYNTDFRGNFLAAPSLRRDGNDGGPFWDSEAMVYQDIKIPLKPETLYFNSGVLLLNVDMFRTIDRKYYDVIVQAHEKEIVFADQDILNLAFEGKVVNISDRRLNCTIAENIRKRKREYRWVKQEAKVVHFVVNPKPWQAGKYRPCFFRIYMKYYKAEGNLLSYLGRYSLWYLMKPVHFINHVMKKLKSLSAS